MASGNVRGSLIGEVKTRANIAPGGHAVSKDQPLAAATDRLATTPGVAVSGEKDLAEVVASVRKHSGGATEQERDGKGAYVAPSVSRPIYTGGAPALRADQMDQAVVQSNLFLRVAYGLEDKAPWVLKAYQGFTRVAGPLGAWLNFGYNVYSAKKILSDPKSPLLIKGAIVGSTVLAGASAVAATRLGLAAFNVLPMATESMKLLGRFAGVAGVGAGTLVSAIDTFNTFRDPNSSAAEKGFSTLATASSLGLTAAVLLGLTGPVGIGLAIGAIGFTLAKGWLAKNPSANKVFSAVGDAAASAGGALSSAGSAIAGGVAKVFSGW